MSGFTEVFARWCLPFCAVLYFLLFQLLFGMLQLFLPFGASQPMFLAFASLFSNLCTAILLVYVGHVSISQLKTTLSGRQLLLLVFFLMAASVGLNILEEYCEIPDNLEDVMMELLGNPLGILAVAIVAPIVEELVFRGALLGGLLKNGISARTAILVSALTFGIIHMNPIQIVFAGIIGILLGWTYWRTGSLMPCILMHVANNSFSVLMFYVSENPQGRISDEVGLVPSIVLLFISVAGTYYLYRYLNKRLPA